MPTKKRALLIATTNKGKFAEISHFLGDHHFKFYSLNDLKKKIRAPKEIEKNFEQNAILKAKYYGEKSGMLALSDDSGIIVPALKGYPGIKSWRIAQSKNQRVEIILKKMLDKKKRSAAFQCSMALYDPETKNVFLASGEVKGQILREPVSGKKINYGYNSIFFVPEAKKSFAEMTIAEKNSVSHRGRALNQIHLYLLFKYMPRNIVVPVGFLVKDGKVLMSLRNDPHRPEYHNRWEFCGGSMEIGEEIKENLLREIKEETGYDVEIIKLLQYIKTDWQGDMNYQVYLPAHVCKIVGGKGKFNTHEHLDQGFFSPDEICEQNMIGPNKQMVMAVLPELKQTIKEHNL